MTKRMLDLSMPHAEGDGGHHHLGVVAAEGVLHRFASSASMPGVVGLRRTPWSRRNSAVDSVALRERQ
jgi:hypothetical protein